MTLLGSGLQRMTQILYGAVHRVAPRVKQGAADERGQTMVEYVVVLLLAVLPLILFGIGMHAALGRYLSAIYFMIGLPIP